MMNKGDRNHKHKEKARAIILNIIRVLLILALLVGILEGRRLIFAVSILALIVTFIPASIERLLGKNVPGDVEVLLIMFIYGVLFFWKVQGFYANFELLSMGLSLAASITLGLVGLTVMNTLHKADKIYANPLVISFFSFCFAIAIGAVWEVAEFGLDRLFGFNLQTTGFGTLGDLTIYMIGAFIVSATGYFHIKKGRDVLISSWLENLIEKNARIFGINNESNADKIKEMLNKGEHHGLEFKSSLRMNLHTNQPDKRMEHAVLKTISAYMNSNGGTLLIGVSDKGEILGVDSDGFESDDALNRHINHLINNHIGAEFSNLIKTNIVNLNGKKILNIECRKSDKEVFLKNGDEEEFYVRQGALSTPLNGSSLIQYIESTFRK